MATNCRPDERRELMIHRDHDAVTANILLSPPRTTSTSTTTSQPTECFEPKRSFTGGGCYVYTLDELDSSDNEDVAVRAKCEIRNAKCEMQNAKCEMRMRNTKCEWNGPM